MHDSIRSQSFVGVAVGVSVPGVRVGVISGNSYDNRIERDRYIPNHRNDCFDNDDRDVFIQPLPQPRSYHRPVYRRPSVPDHCPPAPVYHPPVFEPSPVYRRPPAPVYYPPVYEPAPVYRRQPEPIYYPPVYEPAPVVVIGRRRPTEGQLIGGIVGGFLDLFNR